MCIRAMDVSRMAIADALFVTQCACSDWLLFEEVFFFFCIQSRASNFVNPDIRGFDLS